MKIERTDNEIIIRLPADTDISGLEKLLDFLKLREITSKSKATQKQINELSKEINKDWWERNKDRFPR